MFWLCLFNEPLEPSYWVTFAADEFNRDEADVVIYDPEKKNINDTKLINC